MYCCIAATCGALRCGLHSAGAVGSEARGASAPTEGGEGRRHIVAAARLQLVTNELLGVTFAETFADWHSLL